MRALAAADLPWLNQLSSANDLRAAAWKVAMYLGRTLDRAEPRQVKVVEIELACRVAHVQAIHALDWLVLEGYLIEVDRDGRRTRILRWGL